MRVGGLEAALSVGDDALDALIHAHELEAFWSVTSVEWTGGGEVGGVGGVGGAGDVAGHGTGGGENNVQQQQRLVASMAVPLWTRRLGADVAPRLRGEDPSREWWTGWGSEGAPQTPATTAGGAGGETKEVETSETTVESSATVGTVEMDSNGASSSFWSSSLWGGDGDSGGTGGGGDGWSSSSYSTTW
jgi:hypothetical protein